MPCLPQFNLTPLVVETMEEYARKIAFRLNIKGLINIQFAIKDGKVYVIEANPRLPEQLPLLQKPIRSLISILPPKSCWDKIN